jgi:hypothetical protein
MVPWVEDNEICLEWFDGNETAMKIDLNVSTNIVKFIMIESLEDQEFYLDIEWGFIISALRKRLG